MDDGPRSGIRSRDDASHSYDMTTAVYGMFPSRAPVSSVRRSRAASPAKSATKRKDVDTASPLSIKLSSSTASSSWLPQTKRSRLQIHQMELHQSTCLNLNMASNDSTESDLWILPDFDDWELDSETPQQSATKGEGEWAPLLRRAASSNRERLRARLEGDGWDFVGGKYNEDEKTIQEAVSQSEESVDEEFDVVVLPVLQVSC
ncbi:hypothetical protein CC86DRAFT_399071 [Ophiobolus disseminans]|uniref:Uncharacterized protein n=1 Tax=Ophiobolus disseminans TaxID=1469910 RepID=A0A6A6ZC84_9PLEO|nr:hypothetical protein CC86DRAFT_399071 [Ophiobolus disseminans]